LAEVFGIIENPRYLITRVGRFGRKDYHSVPYILGINKERANMFYNIWHQRVSPGELIYTRSTDGREVLLKARARAFSTAMAPRAERRDRWQ
ncbi:MAG: type III restriction endonuclease subunit R, partial [Chloroflexi bacterium]|nr:type III restriction endonuclease subunit R [Chloroflexota bacterium]